MAGTQRLFSRMLHPSIGRSPIGVFTFCETKGRSTPFICFASPMRGPFGIGALPFRVAYMQGPGRLTVSRDGRWALVNVVDRREGDLMLLDNFR